MNQRRTNRNHASVSTFGFCFVVFAAIAMVGCGRSEPEGPSVVDPPAPTEESASKSGSGSRELSGGLELPEGAIPNPDSESTDASSESGEGIQMPDTAAPGDGVSNSPSNIQYASWQQILASATSSGKITVVDLWSLSCEPCLKEFPNLVRLHNEMGDSVQCIAVDMDYDGRRTRPPEHYADRVGAFLSKVGAAGFPTYISNTPSDDVFTEMDIASLPAVLVYGQDGNVAKVFVDAGETAGFTYEKDVMPLVSNLARK